MLSTGPHECEQGLKTEWQGVAIPLEMDHIDGDSDNNVEENLRLVCPNCHALSPYSKGGNWGRGRERRKQLRRVKALSELLV